MDDLSLQVLKLFIAMGTESLDLHTLFEAGGNDRASRERVLDVVTRLADNGYLESRGSDFYLITDKGRRAVRWVHFSLAVLVPAHPGEVGLDLTTRCGPGWWPVRRLQSHGASRSLKCAVTTFLEMP